MNNRFKFKIAVFERHNNSNEWIFQKHIENDNHWYLNTCGDVCSLGCYSAHYRRDNAPDSVNMVYEPVFCTGLHDKNGKLIYEGDICKNIMTNEIVSVGWHGTMAGYVWSKRKHSNIYDFGELFRAFDKYEVIGNIHTDTHLLEENE